MKILDLQDQLRVHIRGRIGRGELTGAALAHDAGFPQGHLSNFLNARRGLSLESMDRLLDTLGIEVLDLVDPKDLQRRAAPVRLPSGQESVALVAPEHAALPNFTASQVLETRSFKKAFLRRLRPYLGHGRLDWQRFIVLRLDTTAVQGMLPMNVAGATLLIDRHYVSLQPYRRLRPNVYAVQYAGHCALRHVSLIDGQLVLQSREPVGNVELLRVGHGRSLSDYVVGRVCHVGFEV
jgi:hypothetical protein